MDGTSSADQFSSSGGTECERPSAGYHPSVWEEHFLPYASHPTVGFEESALQHKIQELKNEVKKILVEATNNDKPRELLFLIDDIQHLGIGYHFKKEIYEASKYVYQWSCKSPDAARGTINDLHCTAVMFVLLRKKGYNVPCSVFEKFKGQDGHFEELIKHDTRALLSLYEATHLRGQGDHILEEALPFTLEHLALASVNENLTPRMKYEISRALKGYDTRVWFQRLEASNFIKLYQEEPSHNEVLLKLAKLDFNMLQKQHQQELGEMTRWWSSLEPKKHFPFLRDRLVEGYYWGLLLHQPEHTRYRIINTKITAIITLTDDIFDIHGTPEELETIANAVERWDMRIIDELPDNYIKVYYKVLLEVYKDIEQNLTKEARSYGTYFAIKAMKDMVRAYHAEAKWRHQKYTPTFEEYMEDAGYTSGAAIFLSVYGFLGMINIATKDAFEWLFNTPKMVRACQIVIRLLNDAADYEMDIEEKTGQVKAVQCYMKQHGVTDTEAKKHIWKKIKEAWKVVNDEFLALMSMNIIPAPLLTLVVDLARMMTVWHEDFDTFTDATTTMKDAITAVLLDSFPIDI